MNNIPYYRNTTVNLGGFTIGELTTALDDSAAYFNGPAADSDKQNIVKNLIKVGQYVIAPLRALGYHFDIVRTYSEGAVNHGTGFAADLAPHSKTFEDVYGLAVAATQLNTCDQIWIEASDNEGSYHLHVRVNPNHYNPNPDLQTINDVFATSVQSGLVPRYTTISSLESTSDV